VSQWITRLAVRFLPTISIVDAQSHSDSEEN
jgi:hypothetical protein